MAVVERAARGGGESDGHRDEILAAVVLTIDLGEEAELVHDSDDAAVRRLGPPRAGRRYDLGGDEPRIDAERIENRSRRRC